VANFSGRIIFEESSARRQRGPARWKGTLKKEKGTRTNIPPEESVRVPAEPGREPCPFSGVSRSPQLGLKWQADNGGNSTRRPSSVVLSMRWGTASGTVPKRSISNCRIRGESLAPPTGSVTSPERTPTLSCRRPLPASGQTTPGLHTASSPALASWQ
jgi:hypothetical protein